MRVLLDECGDWRLGRELASHDVKTARQMVWTAVKNGELLGLASARFEYLSPAPVGISWRLRELTHRAPTDDALPI